MLKERNGNWTLNKESVNDINAMTGVGFKPYDEADEEVDMCIATQSLINKDISQGENRLNELFKKNSVQS